MQSTGWQPELKREHQVTTNIHLYCTLTRPSSFQDIQAVPSDFGQ